MRDRAKGSASRRTYDGGTAVLQLSIVIPALGQLQLLEETLISVLANRPEDCEILVVLNGDYHDPYELSDEVRFIDAPLAADWAACANLGIARSRAPIVHLLAPGVEVEEGWVQPAMVCFADRRVAIVTPALIDQAQPQVVLLAGHTWSAGGTLADFGAGQPISHLAGSDRSAQLQVGPTVAAGFYRKRAVMELDEPFDSSLGTLAPLETALQLRALGLRARCQLASQVIDKHGTLVDDASPFARGLVRERLFLRHAPPNQWPKALALHAVSVLVEMIGHLPTPARLLQSFGRAAAWLNFREHRRRYADLQALAREFAGRQEDLSAEILPMHARHKTAQQRTSKLRDSAAG